VFQFPGVSTTQEQSKHACYVYVCGTTRYTYGYIHTVCDTVAALVNTPQPTTDLDHMMKVMGRINTVAITPPCVRSLAHRLEVRAHRVHSSGDITLRKGVNLGRAGVVGG
jgi:hypothetical protein